MSEVNYQKDVTESNFNQMLNKSDSTASSSVEIHRVEKELWEQFSLRCCNELTDWNGMCNLAIRNKTLDKLYCDSYSLEYIFPYAFRSNLKLILKEDEQQMNNVNMKF